MTTVITLGDSTHFGKWRKLLARLEDTLNRYAVAHMTEITLLGPVVRASETSKRLVDVRLSAFWVHRQFHGVDIGGNFLDLLIEDWLRSNHDHVIVTVCEDRAAGQEKLFVFRGFLRISMTLDKCEKSENKVVLKWANDSLFSLSLSRRNGSSGAGIDAVTRKGWAWSGDGAHGGRIVLRRLGLSRVITPILPIRGSFWGERLITFPVRCLV